MLMPKKTKYTKQHLGRFKGKAHSGQFVSFGEYGMLAKGRGLLNNQQIEAVRVTISRQLQKGGKIYLRVFPHMPYTKKPAETRMGKGKGNIHTWVCKIRPGQILFEISGVPEELAKKSIRQASFKLPFKTSFVKREVF